MAFSAGRSATVASPLVVEPGTVWEPGVACGAA
jgi:hypothetical protein